MSRCTSCKRRRPTWTAQRFGGGSYRRPGRWYNSQVCMECATEAVEYADGAIAAGRNPGDKVYGYSLRSLRAIAARGDA